MAERQVVFRWIRQNIGAILAAITLSALTVTSLDAGTVTADAITAGDASLDVTAGANALALGTTSGGITASTDTGSVTLQASNGNAGSVVVNVNGVSIDGGDGDSVSLGTTDGTTTNLTTLIGLAETVGLGSGGWPSNHYLLLDGVSAQTELGGGGSTLTLTADTAAFDVPITAPYVAGGTAYRLAPVMDFDYPNAAPGSTAETAMASQMIPASSMTAIGRGIGFEAWGSAAGNTNDKYVRLEFGSADNASGTMIGQCNFSAAMVIGWHMTGRLYRTGPNTQAGVITCTSTGGANTSMTYGSSAITDTAPTYAVITVTNVTAASDLSVEAVRWFWL